MELQLGLALPNHGRFDLNCNGFQPKDTLKRSFGCCFMETNGRSPMKRSFTEAFEDDDTGTLPLLVWHGQPNEEDHPKEQRNRTSNARNNNEENQNHIVGWPPIKSQRKKLLHQHLGRGWIENVRMPRRGCNDRNSMYVKVKMEGEAIGRKIDLRLYHSYQTLTNTLISMFAKCRRNDEDGVHYTLLYQDREGDWLLAGDIPWQTFLESVQRMKILTNAGKEVRNGG